MPVDDHPVHKKTKIGADFRYGCHNRGEFMPSYYAPNRAAGTNGHQPVWFYERVRVPHAMSKDCRYDGVNDPACEGCKWKKQ